MARRSIEDTESDFMALLADLDTRMNALKKHVSPAEHARFDKSAELAARTIQRSMILTYSLIQRADAIIDRPRPRGGSGNVITLRPRRGR